jgi:hypothetical protein
MRLNFDDLRQLYFSKLKENMPATRKGCPSPKQLLQLVRSKKSEKKKTRIINHILECYHCANEFDLVFEALRYEEEMNQAVQKFVGTRKTKDVSPRNSWRLATILSGTSLLFVFILLAILPFRSRAIKYRNSGLPRINLILPQGKNIPKTSLSFKWEDVKGSEYYIIELFDDTLYQIWTSEKISQNQYTMSDAASSQLAVNRAYFFIVSAVFPNGRRMESPLREFQVTE